MAKPVFSCVECGYAAPKFLGRCPNCGAWGSFQEAVETSAAGDLVELGAVDPAREPRFSSGIAEFDRVLGGGFVPGEVVLLGGEPGVGKSTLLLGVADRLLQAGQKVIYLAGEESLGQVGLRARRVGVHNKLLLSRETRLNSLMGQLKNEKPDVAIIDSIQTLQAEGGAGSLLALRESALRLTELAKSQNIATILVGHVTKEGSLAGPKVVEHAVDATLYLETAGIFRVLRGVKNRFGPAGEVGVFRMEEEGLLEVSNPSQAFLAERPLGVAGSVVGMALSGERTLALEVQALAVKTSFAIPKRVVQGLDPRRVDLILAILENRLELEIGKLDLYLNLAGGLRVNDPGLDLAIALAAYSAVRGQAAPAELAAAGELGLAGEIRSVEGLQRRINESRRAGFVNFVHPGEARNIGEVIKEVFR